MYIDADPDAFLDYSWDWSAWLEGDVITAHEIIADVELIVESSEHTDAMVTAWVSGGILGKVHDMTCRITTQSGRIDDRTIKLSIKQR